MLLPTIHVSLIWKIRLEGDENQHQKLSGITINEIDNIKGIDKLSVPLGLMTSVIVVIKDADSDIKISFWIVKSWKNESPARSMKKVDIKNPTEPIYVLKDVLLPDKPGQNPDLRLRPVTDATGSLIVSTVTGIMYNDKSDFISDIM